MATSIADFIHTDPDWVASTGQASTMIVSSRARIARNMAAIPFVHRMKKHDGVRVMQKVDSAIRHGAVLAHALFTSMLEASELERQFLVERRLISPALADNGKKEARLSGVFIHPSETISVMVNEEDHLRMQTIRGGLQLERVWREADTLDTELSQALDFAYSPQFGYLTACPTNVGTGIRMSVLIHLPGLVLTKQMESVVRGMMEVGLTVRGLYGEGTETVGNLFQLSNQRTLGQSEDEIVSNLDHVARQLMTYEARAYEALSREASIQLEDRIWRSYGLLQHARLLTVPDALTAISMVRLGFTMGLLTSVDVPMLNRLLLITQPAHVQHMAGITLDGDEQLRVRAELVRRVINTPLKPAFRQPTDRPT